MEKGIVCYIGDFKLPNKNANANLVLGNSRILRDLGYSVVLIGNDDNGMYSLGEQPGDAYGFPYYNLLFAKNLRGYLDSKHQFAAIENQLEAYLGELKAIVTYGSLGFAVVLRSISVWCRKNNIPLIANCVDLTSLAHGTALQRIIKWLDRQTRERAVVRYADGFIVVSRYLYRHYCRFNRPCIIIPPLVDHGSIPCSKFIQRQFPLLVYGGVPFPIDGRVVDERAYKDRLDWAIDYLYEVKKQGAVFEFHIVGITKDQYLSVVRRHAEVIELLKGCVVFRGALPYNAMLDVIAGADFTFILRDSNRMTNAGFSTKIAESISCGTPVITTDTSDIRERVIDLGLGFTLATDDKSRAVKELGEILRYDRSTIYGIKQRCRNSKAFMHDRYISVFKEFLEKVL